jgi:hypothetical protein
VVGERCSRNLIAELELKIVLDDRLVKMGKCVAQETAIDVDQVFKFKTVLGHLLIEHLGDEIKEALRKLVRVLLFLHSHSCTLHEFYNFGNVRIFLQ